MPFKAAPKLLTMAVCEYIAKRSNWYPPKGGISSHYSPHKILTRRDIDWEHHCAAEIGSFVHAWGHDTNNSQKCRVIQGIYLGPTDSLQEGHKILNLETGKEVTRPKIQAFPMTRQIIKMVENLAAAEGVYHFHTYSRNAEGELILDADLLAEVDEEELFDEDYEEEEYTENRSDNKLQNEHITKEEVAELLADAEEHGTEIEASDSEDDNYDSDAESEASDDSTSHDNAESDADEHSMASDQDSDEESDQDQHKKTSDEKTEVDTIDKHVQELDELLTTKEDQGDDNSEEKIEFLEELTEESKNTTEESDNDDDQTQPRRTRSGKSYIQNGIKMRPSIREGTNRHRYDQPYLQKKKTKPN